MARTTPTTEALLVTGLCLLLAVGAAGAFGLGPATSAPVAAQDGTPQEQTPQSTESDDSSNVSEQRYVEPAPEEGDEYYEAEADDGSWISYVNPRDRYRDPIVGNASGKICVTLRNEAGEVVVGESIPGTTVTIPTPTLYWHSHADPMVVEFPLTDNYDRPLDADQFGTTDDLPQGDGYMDAHCIEYHGPRENKTIEYGEAAVHGPYADDVEVVGYIQQAHEAWDSDVDPYEDAVSYEEAGGEWTMREGASHGQVTVVLQLTGVEQRSDDVQKDQQQPTATMTPSPTAAGTPTATATATPMANATENGTDGRDARDDGDEPVLDQDGPGYGVVVVAVFGTLIVLVRRRS